MADNNTPSAATVDTTPTTSASQVQQTKPEDMAAAFLAALDARTQRAERSVAKSFGEQYGMTDTEINAILADAKAKKAAAIPADVQAQIDAKEKALNDKIIAAEIKAKGSTMGLVDPEIAMQIMDKTQIKIGDKGNVEGVNEALESLRNLKPFLFSAQPTGEQTTVGAKLTGDNPSVSGVEAAFLARNPGLKI